MKVLFHVLDAGVGGGQLVAERVARHLAGRDDSVTLVVGGEGPLTAAFAALGARVELRELADARRPQVAFAARRLVRGHDLLYSHTSAPGQIVCAAAAAVARRPHVAHQHTYPFFGAAGRRASAQQVVFQAMTRKTRFIAVADHVAAGLIRAGVAQGRISIVSNGVPIPPELPAVVHEGPLRVGMVARLDPNKGLETFVEAAARVPDATFMIAGSPGPYAAFEADLRRAAADAGVSIVESAGEPFIATLDVLVVPSRHEGSPLVVLEGLAQGRALIASDIDGIREALAPDAGILVPPGDALAIAAAVRRLFDPAERDRLGARARSVAATRYRLDAMLERTTAVLDSAAHA